MKKITILLSLLILSSTMLFAQEDTTETVKKVKKGFSFGGVPVVAYDSDVGFKYGLLANIYHYGDGSRYPAYDHSLYLEWSRTTKGNGANILKYDSERLIPNIRTTLEASYRTEKALNFYGFNGYNAHYDAKYEDEQDADYISRAFYRYERNVVRLKADFQGNIIGKKLRWIGGLTYMGSEIATVDIDQLNEGKDEADLLPDVPGLYDNYVDWGVISQTEKDGGNVTLLKTGVVFDTRDNEPNPNSGMWTEALFLVAPSFMGDYEKTGTALILIHRQYFSIFPKKMTFAYRLSYQTKTGGNIPFYLLPYLYDSYDIRDGLGGAKTMRGILRNRIVGDGMAFGNFEFRWKVLQTSVFNQNFYIALSAFTDMGRVVDPYKQDLSGVPTAERELWFNNAPEAWHISYGAGVHFALNDNFIIAVDYGMAAQIEDGTSGIYIGLNFLY